MSNPKFKNEAYTNFGGINTKYSPYLTQPMEFLSIQNFDFQTIGALTQRWGSTQYIGQTFAGSINALQEISYLNGNSGIMIGVTGGIWFGSTQTQMTGLSFTVNGTTQVNGVIGFAIAGGWDIGGFNSKGEAGIYIPNASNTQLLPIGATVYQDPFLLVDDTVSVKVMNNYAFMADGNKFCKFDGVTTTMVSLPQVSRVLPPGSGAFPTGVSIAYTNAFTQGWPAVGVSGIFYCYFTYVNNRGFEGPLTPMALINSNFDGSTIMNGGSFLQYAINVATPLQYGISAINQYIYWVPGVAAGANIGSGTANSIGATISPYIFDPVYLNTTPASGSTTTWVNTGTGFFGNGYASVQSNVGTFYNNLNYTPVNATFTGLITEYQNNNAQLVPTEYDLNNNFPRFLEVYQNRLFSAGYSLAPSLVWFSDSTEPEGYNPTFNFETRTNDSDYITCLQAYSQGLYIFKKNSFHLLSGDNPNNFFLQEVSPIFGCVNNRCAVLHDNMMVFLDRKGIIEFNGSSMNVLSLKVQNFFDRMNYTAALTTACMSHDKLRNQLLISIPIDGSTTNNLLLVYDYAVTAWTTYTGIQATVFAQMQGVNNTRYPFYGDYLGRVNQFSPTMIADNGVGPTLYFKSKFMHDLGNSVTKQFRRLYMDNTVQSSTYLVSVNFYQDYGPSIVVASTMNIGVFQDRIDFGIAAKAVAFEIYAQGASSPLNIYGYTMEERMQRNV